MKNIIRTTNINIIINIIMAGGLMQIVSYGSQDLFLTGVPEITFFKIVYRRHTSFSMESVQVNFDNNVGFKTKSTLRVPKIGDLIHKTYLQVNLPAVQLQRQFMPDPAPFRRNLDTAKQNYQIVVNFMTINRNAFVSAYNLFIPENNVLSAMNDMVTAIQNIFSIPGNQKAITDMMDLLISTDSPFTYNEISMDTIAGNYDITAPTASKDELFQQLEYGIDKSIKTQGYFYNQLLIAKAALTDILDPNIQFAWVDRIGHSIINYIEIRIGGQKIDRQYGDWLNIWYELSLNRSMAPTYNRMIGNVPELTGFNRLAKPAYILKIPLQFWFCRFSGLAIPLIALEYHNVSMQVQFRDISDVAYTEPGDMIKFSLIEGGINLSELVSEANFNIQASMFIDYIYLDTPERKRFAQSSHEYLIEQTQMYEQHDVTQQQIQINVNNFVHPTKEMIWVAQKERYMTNPTFSTKCQWSNYSMTDENIGNPVAFSSIDFNSYNRVVQLDGNYFNYVQPYESHRATPSDGINVYSFAIFPEEQQPSGSANLSRISRTVVYMTFDNSLFVGGVIVDPLDIRIYTRNINILRVINGFAGIAWVYG